MSERFDPSTISNKQLINELIKLSKKLGKTPSRSDMVKKGNEITKRLWLYGDRFGGLTEACHQAGLIANKGGVDLKYSEEELLNEILYLENVLGRVPSQKDINEKGKYSINAYKARFGTYNKALSKISLKKNVQYNLSVAVIKQDILEVAKALGRSPTVNEFSEMSTTVSANVACKKITGTYSWNDTLKKCGLDVVYNKNLTNEELKEEIIRLKEELGRVPGYNDMSQFGKYSATAYSYRFGTYLEALKYFGFEYMANNQWNKQTITIGKDGNSYLSIFEASIADILYEFKNKNLINDYSYEKLVTPKRKWTCDFYIVKNGIEYWIEADGMGKNRETPYSENHEKILYYRTNNYNYHVIDYKSSYKLSLESILFFQLHDNIDFSNRVNKIEEKPYAMNDCIIWDGNKLTKDFCSKLSLEERTEIAYHLVDFFHRYDFNTMNYSTKALKEDFDGLVNHEFDISNKSLNNNISVGCQLCRYFVPSVLKISSNKRLSSYDALKNINTLKKIVYNRMGITYKEFFNITPAMIIQGSKSSGQAASGSIFKPTAAKAIYKYWVKPGDKVYDYSSGFGGRLIGFHAARIPDTKYFACEPSSETFDGLTNMVKMLNINAEIYKVGSEDFKLDTKMDFIFSSPPYFDYEIYCNEETQSANKYKVYEQWLEKYWVATIKNIKSMCHENSIFGVNAGNQANDFMKKLENDMNSLVASEGFELIDTWHLTTMQSHLNKKSGTKKENIYFYKLKNY